MCGISLSRWVFWSHLCWWKHYHIFKMIFLSYLIHFVYYVPMKCAQSTVCFYSIHSLNWHDNLSVLAFYREKKYHKISLTLDYCAVLYITLVCVAFHCSTVDWNVFHCKGFCSCRVIITSAERMIVNLCPISWKWLCSDYDKTWIEVQVIHTPCAICAANNFKWCVKLPTNNRMSSDKFH